MHTCFINQLVDLLIGDGAVISTGFEDGTYGIVRVTCHRRPAGEGDVIVPCILLGFEASVVRLNIQLHIEAVFHKLVAKDVDIGLA